MYNNRYNNRHSGRFNNMSNFVPGHEQNQSPQQQYQRKPQQNQKSQQQIQQNQQQVQQPQQQMQQSQQPMEQQMQQPQQHIQQPENMESEPIQEEPMEVKVECETTEDAADETARPPWMKSKLPGVKKVTTRERRRRQNETLRRLITPKNALMVLNEMLTNEQVTNQFKVEPAVVSPFYKATNPNSFCAELSLHGKNYMGYGETKMASRNAAAEQAIRDLIIQRLEKISTAPPATAATPAPPTNGSDPEDQESAVAAPEPCALPMIQLASFALHKLFSEWEYDGHKIPAAALKPGANAASESGEPAAPLVADPPAAPAAPAAPRAPRRPHKGLPSNAAQLHPCMLLAYMKNTIVYKELAAEGTTPQTMSFTFGADVDTIIYVGKASNKKEARRQAAKAACEELFGVVFDEKPTCNTPLHN